MVPFSKSFGSGALHGGSWKVYSEMRIILGKTFEHKLLSMKNA
jgi:hypothetical protein